jgi:hypothetical protein
MLRSVIPSFSDKLTGTLERVYLLLPTVVKTVKTCNNPFLSERLYG